MWFTLTSATAQLPNTNPRDSPGGPVVKTSNVGGEGSIPG